MKTNKGFTLVELLVAVAILLVVMAEVGALMVNSQKLYTNGYYEVSLQESAQQVMQQVSDMLMNANVEKGVTIQPVTTDGVPSHKIIIKMKDRHLDTSTGTFTGTEEAHTYTIERRADIDGGGMKVGKNGDKYSDLVLVKDSGDPILIAEGVHAIHITTSDEIDPGAGTNIYNLETANMFSIKVDMANQYYTYSDTSEIYSRNMVGTGVPDVGSSGAGSSADVDINVLRIHDYDLSKFVPASYNGDYEFQDSDLENYYDLHDGHWIKCKATLNSSAYWPLKKEGMIYAYTADRSAYYKVYIKTDPVNDGGRVPVYTWAHTTAPMINAVPVTGICTCTGCVDSVVMDAQMTLPLMEKKDIYIPFSGHGATVHVDLPLYGGGYNGFEYRMHQNETEGGVVERYMGTEVPILEDVINWHDEVFARARGFGSTLDIGSAWFRVEPRTLKDGADTKWDGTYVEGGVTKYYRDKNYNLVYASGNSEHYVFFPANTSGGNVYPKFTLSSIHVDNKANAFGLTTDKHCDRAEDYWNYIVDNDGYVRIHIWCKFNGLADNYDNIYDCYGYYFPENAGTSTQKGNLLNNQINLTDAEIPASDKNVADGSSDPKPYDYYDYPHP